MGDPIFQRGLQDLIKGIRSHKKDVSPFISKTISEIKTELRSTDPFIKAEAVRKLTYLQMIGYNVSWASFSIVEVMSQPRFGHKRIGYLAANQSFTEDTDVLLLTTNLFKKEMVNNTTVNQYEIGLAINCLANIANKDLARDCLSDMVALMHHSRPYIRKKAVLSMYKLYVKFPQGLRLTFDKLKECLDDDESSVVSCAVNAICELANKNPRNYLALAPKFFRLLTTSSNNWMLIKVVKLLSSLVSEEPRLARKLLEPLATIIQNTSAKSLQYECIYTVTEALPYSKREDGSEAKNAAAVIKLCSDYLRGFIEDNDQNLKYLGLVGLVMLMRSHPRSVVEHRDLILLCLNDDDVTIRTKALELLSGIVSRKSLVNLVHHLLEHARLAEGRYREEIIAKILLMGKRDKYSMVSDFAWYISVLLELAVMPGVKHGKEVADQLMEIALRVDNVRPFAVEKMLSLLLNDSLVLTQARFTVYEVLKAAAWISGEYSSILTQISRDIGDDGDNSDDEDDDTAYWIEAAKGEEIRSVWRGQPLHSKVMQSLIHPRTTNLPPTVQVVYIHSAVKIFVQASNDCDQDEISNIVGILRDHLPVFMQSQNLEIQERATTFRHLLSVLDILPMNWEEGTELIANQSTASGAISSAAVKDDTGIDDKQKQIMDLLDMPVYTRSSVQAVDDYGGRVALEKKRILKALCAEDFYAVHSKAQRRVPLPENFDPDTAFNQKALDNLLSVPIPQDLSINQVSFVRAPSDMPSFEKQDIDFGSSPFDSAYDNVDAIDDDTEKITHIEHHTNNTESNTRSDADDVFKLSTAKQISNQDLDPLSKVLAESFQEPASSRRKAKRKDKTKAQSTRNGTDVNFDEMLPAGAMASDDEEESNTNSKSITKSNRRRIRNSEADEDLTSVDITTPLRPDEVLVEPTHRTVPLQQTTPSIPEHKQKKKKKHNKAEKDKKSSKTKKTDDIDLLLVDNGVGSDPIMLNKTENPNDNLLGLDWPQNPPNSETSAPNNNEKKNKSSKESVVWISLCNTQNVTVMYHASCKNMSLELQFKVVNCSQDGSNVTLSASLDSQSISNKQNSIPIATNVASGQSTQYNISVDMTHTQEDSPVVIGCDLSITVTSSALLDGGDARTIQLSENIIIPRCASFKPLKLDETEFTAALEKALSSSKSSSITIAIPISQNTKSKTIYKSISKYLHAHIIEVESSGRAASMSAKTGSGGTVLILAKINRDNEVQLDIKCTPSSKSKQSSKDLAQEIAQALTLISL